MLWGLQLSKAQQDLSSAAAGSQREVDCDLLGEHDLAHSTGSMRNSGVWPPAYAKCMAPLARSTRLASPSSCTTPDRPPICQLPLAQISCVLYGVQPLHTRGSVARHLPKHSTPAYQSSSSLGCKPERKTSLDGHGSTKSVCVPVTSNTRHLATSPVVQHGCPLWYHGHAEAGAQLVAVRYAQGRLGPPIGCSL